VAADACTARSVTTENIPTQLRKEEKMDVIINDKAFRQEMAR
jgi:hypothetical protein